MKSPYLHITKGLVTKNTELASSAVADALIAITTNCDVKQSLACTAGFQSQEQFKIGLGLSGKNIAARSASKILMNVGTERRVKNAVLN